MRRPGPRERASVEERAAEPSVLHSNGETGRPAPGERVSSTSLKLGSRAERARAESRAPAWLRRLLAVPLLTKIVGANAIIVALAALIALRMHDLVGPGRELAGVMIVALVVSLFVNLSLVAVALQPMRDLEETAGRVWRGDLEARVPGSLLADRDMSRIGGTLNALLDGLTADRERMRRLAAQVISAQDEERSRIARELHDSTAQSLAALVLQLGAATRDCPDEMVGARLEEIRGLAGAVLEEVRTLSHTVHPRVLEDLGLEAALEWLARNTQASSGVEIAVETSGDVGSIPPSAAAVLYRVAQEALSNAVRHADAESIAVTVAVDGGTAALEVADDGRGFDPAEAESRRPGMGLFSMRERVSLADGRLNIISAPAAGTRVLATVPFEPLRQL